MSMVEESSYLFHQKTVRLLHEVRVIVFEDTQLRFTPIEYRMMQHLLTGQPVPDSTLMADIFHCGVDLWSREALEKHVINLRRKLKKCPQLRILRVATFGYVLLFEESL